MCWCRAHPSFQHGLRALLLSRRSKKTYLRVHPFYVALESRRVDFYFRSLYQSEEKINERSFSHSLATASWGQIMSIPRRMHAVRESGRLSQTSSSALHSVFTLPSVRCFYTVDLGLSPPNAATVGLGMSWLVLVAPKLRKGRSVGSAP